MPGQRIKAAREMAAAEMKTLGTPMEVTPQEAITLLLQQAAGLVAAMTTRLQALDDLGGEESRGDLMVFNSERDRLARFAKIATEIGVEERAIKIAEAQTKMMSDLIRGIANRLELTPEQRRALGPAIREELATIDVKGKERVK